MNVGRHTFPRANFELFDVHGGANLTCGDPQTDRQPDFGEVEDVRDHCA